VIWGCDTNNVEATTQFHETGLTVPDLFWRARALSFPFLLDAQRTKFVLPVRDAFPREKIAAPCPRLTALGKLGLSRSSQL
jgi:hypothetical protein